MANENLNAKTTEARQREIAVEHLLFKTMEYVERIHPGLLDTMDKTIDHLWDHANDDTRDDEAVREIARRMIRSARDRKSPA